MILKHRFSLHFNFTILSINFEVGDVKKSSSYTKLCQLKNLTF